MEFLDKLLEQYRNSFDIERDYKIGDVTAQAYGYFAKTDEKYVLSQKANLWSVQGFEHILFFEKESVCENDILAIRNLMVEYMAPNLVCKGKKYPEKDHMYSYLTVVMLCKNTPDNNTVSAVESFKFTKNYLLTIRGYVEGQVVVMDLSAGKAYTNKAAKHLKKFYENEYETYERGLKK